MEAVELCALTAGFIDGAVEVESSPEREGCMPGADGYSISGVSGTLEDVRSEIAAYCREAGEGAEGIPADKTETMLKSELPWLK